MFNIATRRSLGCFYLHWAFSATLQHFLLQHVTWQLSVQLLTVVLYSLLNSIGHFTLCPLVCLELSSLFLIFYYYPGTLATCIAVSFFSLSLHDVQRELSPITSWTLTWCGSRPSSLHEHWSDWSCPVFSQTIYSGLSATHSQALITCKRSHPFTSCTLACGIYSSFTSQAPKLLEQKTVTSQLT